MEVLEAIKTRRSIRKYKKDPVPQEKINKILDAARWAPSGHNSQPWEFIILRDANVRKDLAKVLPFGGFMADAPLGIAVVVDPAASFHPIDDGAAATQNILLATHTLGLGGCWIGTSNTPYEEAAKDVLGVPKEKILLSVVPIGYPDQSPERTRKELIIFNNRYGSKLS